FTLSGFLAHVLISGGVREVFGSEGIGMGHLVPWTSRLLYGLAILSGSWYVLPKAWFALKHLRPDMNLLMSVAVLGAVLLGEWFEAATVSFLFALSLTLESWSVGRARRAVAALLDLTPPTARLLREGGKEEEVPAETVTPGERIVVRPGERFPV